MPADFPPNARLRGIIGTVSTTTSAAPDGAAVWSETLFSVHETQNQQCPVNVQSMPDYGSIDARYPGLAFGNWIVKQAVPGAVSLPIAIDMPNGFPLLPKAGDCMFVTFDGSDFASRPYTMAIDVQFLYDSGAPAMVNAFGGEFIVSPNTWDGAHLNAYSVLPVSKNGPVHPGTLQNIYGDLTATSSIGFESSQITSGAWSERQIVAIYHDGSCQKAFPNHGGGLFSWNDLSGARGAENPSSVFWPTSQILIDVTLSGYGVSSAMKPAVVNLMPPIPLEEGDCLVTASLPGSDTPYMVGNSLNVEQALLAVTLP